MGDRGDGDGTLDRGDRVSRANRGRGRDRVGSVVGHSECCADLGPGAPTYGDPIAKVLAFHAENRGASPFAVAQRRVNLPLLLVVRDRTPRAGAGVAGVRAPTGRASRWPPARHSRRSSRSTPWPWTSGRTCRGGLAEPSPAVQARLAAPCSEHSLWRCRRSARPSSALHWRRMRSGWRRPWQRVLGVAGRQAC